MYQYITPPQDHSENKRVRYIDTLRGFTMLLVVFQHVRYFMCGMTDTRFDALAFFIVSFFMPMFFFISGYVAPKTIHHKTKEIYLSNLKIKAMVLLIPTIVFWISMTIVGLRTWQFPGGFWFTEVLFEMFLIYFTIAFICRKLKSSVIENIVLLTVTLILFSVKGIFLIPEIQKYTSYFCLVELCNYFPFFFFGLMSKKYKDLFFKVCDNGYLMMLMIVTAFVLLICQYKFDVVYFSGPINQVKGVILVAIIFTCFRHSEAFWSKKNMFTDSMVYVGRRTLDLYMLHYFLLMPVPVVGEFITSLNSNIVIELLIIGLLTLVVTFISLQLSNLIRTSSVLSKLLFGVKKTPKPNIAVQN